MSEFGYIKNESYFQRVDPPSWKSESDKVESFKNLGENARTEHAQNINKLRELLSQTNPLKILSIFAYYDLSHRNVYKGDIYRPLEQNSVEFLQAFILKEFDSLSNTMSIDPNCVTPINEILWSISESWKYTAVDQLVEADCPEKKSIQQQFQENTFLIRNVGYPSQIIHEMTGVFENLDPAFSRKYGVKATSLIRLWENIVELFRERILARHSLFSELRRSLDARDVVETFTRKIPISELEGQRLYETLALGLTKEQAECACSYCLDDHLDLMFSLTLDELSNLCPEEVSKDSLRSVLHFWSLPIGGLSGHDLNHIMMDNPVWSRPLIAIEEDLYLFPLFQCFVSFGIKMMESLVFQDPRMKEKYHQKHRKEYLEKKVCSLCSQVFGAENTLLNAKWETSEGKNAENDVVVLCDTFVLIFECKSARVSDRTKRGSWDSLKSDLKELVLDADEQSNKLKFEVSRRTEELLLKNDSGNELRIDPSKVYEVIRINCTLDYIGHLVNQPRLLKDAGLIDQSAIILPTLPVVDLEMIFDILRKPHELIHYFSRRLSISNNCQIYGDECDLIVFYLKNGFCIGELEYKGDTIDIWSLSKELDEFYLQEDFYDPNRKCLSKQYSKLWENLLGIMEQRRFRYWSIIAYKFLNVPIEDQRKFENDLEIGRKETFVMKVGENARNTLLFEVGPTDRRDTFVAYFVKDMNREDARNMLQHIMTDIKNSQHMKSIIGIAFDCNNDLSEYQMIAILDDRLPVKPQD